jgi:hypothetical protein
MANTNPRKFALDIEKFSAAVGVSYDQVIKKLAFDALEGVLRRSPVKTGRFRGSWRVAKKTPNLSVLPPGNSSAGASPTGEQLKEIQGITILDTVHISNNLPYAEKLERGSSLQAPAGVLAVTFQDLVGQANRIIAEAGSQNGVR